MQVFKGTCQVSMEWLTANGIQFTNESTIELLINEEGTLTVQVETPLYGGRSRAWYIYNITTLGPTDIPVYKEGKV